MLTKPKNKFQIIFKYFWRILKNVIKQKCVTKRVRRLTRGDCKHKNENRKKKKLKKSLRRANVISRAI